MTPAVINRCKRRYRINVEKMVNRIVDRIPEKFLDGLLDISLLDFGKKHYPMCRYIEGNGDSRLGRIEIYLDNQDFTGIPFFSALALNIHLLLAINQHIDKYVKTKTEDREILSANTSRINYSWMYFGLWNPLLAVFRVFDYAVSQSRLFRMLLKRWADRLTGEPKAGKGSDLHS
jgi:hypothetical protein